MTKREKQILEILANEPMISQEDLAERLGVARSSAAVHISNLMKKGYILGKGYVLNEPFYITVVGGASIDIGGKATGKLIAKDSNPGKVTLSPGGVGRNIAQNIALLGGSVRFISAWGEDVYGHHITESCKKYQIDIKDCIRSTTESTSSYLYIASNDGDMSLAIADMDIFQKITPEFMQNKMDILNHGELIVLDANLPEETISYICRKAKVPVFVDPVSTAKAARIRTSLEYIHTFTPNALEASVLSNMEIDVNDQESLSRAARFFLKNGVKRVIITLGEKGVFCASEDGEFSMRSMKVKNPKNATGAGDAMMAGLAMGYTKEYDFKKSVRIGMAASYEAIESPNAVNDEIEWEKVYHRAKLMHA